MNKYNSSKLVKDIISASSSPTVCNQSLTNSCLAQQDKLSVVKGFTLIEVMIVTTILATLATTTVVALNPVELLAQMRDSQRITTIGMLRDAVSLLVADRPATNLGDTALVYISLPSNDSNCTDIVGLPALPAGQTYRCVNATNLTRIDGGGWIPLDFRGITDGSPFTVLPIDVTNTPTLFYSYIPSAGGRVTLSARIESIRQRTIHPTGIFTTHFTATVDRPPLGTGQVVVPLGTAGAPSYTFIGDLNTGIFSPGADAIGLSTAGTIRMSIDNMGNVGIGTPTPGNRLTVAGIIHSTTGGFMFPDGTIQITAGEGGGGGALPAGALAGQTLRWTGTAWVANDNLFNTGSNVGIGTTVPVTNLHVSNPGGHGLLRVEGRAGQGGVQIVSSGTFSPFINFGTGGVVGNMGTIFADGATGNMQFRTADNINRLIITNTTGNVGIGTTSPLSRVVIQGHGTTTAGTLNVTASDGASRFFVRDDGNVGIGTTTPTTRLDIEGQIRIRGGSPAVGRVLTSDATGLAVWAVPTGGLPTGTVSQTLRHDGTTWVANNNLFNTGSNIGIGTTSPLSRVQIQGHGTTTAGALNITDSAGTSRFFVRDDGNVGIGTTTPTSPLHVMNLPIFANNVVALERGLTAGAIYRTPAGALMVVMPPPPTVSISASPNPIASGASTAITWITTNATSCSWTAGFSGTAALSGNQSTGALTANRTYTLSCTGAGGSASDSVTVIITPPPTAYFLFSSGSMHSGNLGGRTGANNICRTSASRPAVCTSADRTWAFISVSDTDEIRDFPSTVPAWTGGTAFNTALPWLWRHGTHAGIIAGNNWADLFDGWIINPATSGGLPSGQLWTNSTFQGVSLNSCSNMTDASMITIARIGNTNVQHSHWLDELDRPCSENRPIICACF